MAALQVSNLWMRLPWLKKPAELLHKWLLRGTLKIAASLLFNGDIIETLFWARPIKHRHVPDHLQHGAVRRFGDAFGKPVPFLFEIGELDFNQFVQGQFVFDACEKSLAHAVVPYFEDGFEKLRLAFEAATVGGCQCGLQAAKNDASRKRTQERKGTDLRTLFYMKHIFISRWIGSALVLGGFSLTAQAGVLKASPAPPTPFLDHPQTMSADPARAPFDKVWYNPSPRAWDRVKGFDRVVILPVNTSYLKLRPRQQEDVANMAAYMREQFQQEFAKGGKYHVMLKPGGRTLEIQLALVELKPTNVPGNLISTGAGVVVPGANFVGEQLTHGNIAFEAKLRNGETGELLAEFADRENDKLAPLSFRDYSANAHSRRAVQDWAKQMEELASTPRSHKVAGAMRVTLNPF